MKAAVSETCQKVSYSFKQKRIFLKLYPTIWNYESLFYLQEGLKWREHLGKKALY